MNENERNFLISEFETSWQMILAFDKRRFLTIYSYTVLLILLTTVIFFSKSNTLTITLAIIGEVAGFTYVMILKRERDANERYRNKINALRKIFLANSENEGIQEYLSHSEYGIIVGGGQIVPFRFRDIFKLSKTLHAVYLLLFLEMIMFLVIALAMIRN